LTSVYYVSYLNNINYILGGFILHNGDILKFLRNYHNLTQIELSVIIGVKKSSVQKYEAGNVPLKLETVRKLCDYFQVQPWTFVYPEYFTPADLTLQLELNSKAITHLQIIRDLDTNAREKLFAYANDLLNAQKFIEKR